MVKGLHLPPRHRQEIVALLHKHLPSVEVWAYGSRVNGRSHDGSDLDLVLRGPQLAEIDASQLAEITEVLREATVPFLIEARDWARLPKSFHREIEREHVVMVGREERTVVGEWCATTIGEVVTLQRGFDLPKTERKPGNHLVIASTGPVGAHNEAAVRGPGVVIGRSGSLGGGQFIKQDFWPLNTTLWVKDFKGNDPRFCYFLLKSLDLEQFNVGSGVPTLNRNHVHPLPVSLPPLPEQRAIAHILGTLDDKIELNRRMNETLEAMARALFKSWFVDFDPVRAKMEGRDTGLPKHLADLFPDQLVDSELGEIPEEWEVKVLAECTDLTMGQSPPGSTYNGHGEGLPFFQGRSDFGFRYPSNRRFCTAPNRIAQPGDTLVSVRAPVGDINMAWDRCCIGRGVAALRHKSSSMSFTYYSTWMIQTALRDYEHTGTVFGAVNKSQFEALRVIEPDSSIVDALDSCARPLDARIKSNTLESLTLTALRDTLLPKLVSGEVRIGKS